MALMLMKFLPILRRKLLKKIEQGFYDLETESGIKKGINRNPNQQIHLEGNRPGNQGGGNGCC